jgi:hypothetical protein
MLVLGRPGEAVVPKGHGYSGRKGGELPGHGAPACGPYQACARREIAMNPTTIAERPTEAPSTLDEHVRDFLAQRRIAVTGVSAKQELTGNFIYRKLKAAGYQVFAVNPETPTFDGDLCYPDLAAIPGGVDAVVIVNRPEVTNAIVR